MKIALVEKAACSIVVQKDVLWTQLCKKLSRVIPGEKDGHAWMPTDIDNGPRNNSRVSAISALVLDVENRTGLSPPHIDEIRNRLVSLGLTAHVHTSYNNSRAEPRYRVILKLGAPLQPTSLKHALSTVALKLGLQDCWDTNCTDAARLYYLPRCPEGKEQEFQFFSTAGRDLTPDDLHLAALQPAMNPAVNTITATIHSFPSTAETPANVARVASMVHSISPTCHRNLWRDIVWAVMSTGWSCAEQLALEWSRSAPESFEQGEFDNVVKSFDPTKGIGLGTLHYQAGKAGWIDNAGVPAPDERFTFRTLEQLKALPPITWRVKGLLPEQGFVVIYGPPASGKSFLVIDLLAKIDTGADFFGARTKPCPVVYVALEGVGGIAKRFQAYESFHKIKLSDSLRVVTDNLSLLNADVEVFAQNIISAGLAGGVIVIDTLAQSAPGADENASGDMGMIIFNAQRLSKLTGGLTILIHHTGKDATKGARGHSSLMGAADVAIEVKKPAAGKEWCIAKAKDGEEGITHPFCLEVIAIGQDEEGVPITSCVAVGDLFRKIKPPPPQGRNQLAVLSAIKSKYQPGELVAEVDILNLIKQTLPCGRPVRRGKEALQSLVDLNHLIVKGGDYEVA